LKDQRYKAVKSMIQTKSLKGLHDVFTIIPMSIAATDMKTNYNTLSRRVTKGGTLTLDNILQLAQLIEVDPDDIFKLAMADMTVNKKRASPKS